MVFVMLFMAFLTLMIIVSFLDDVVNFIQLASYTIVSLVHIIITLIA